MSANKFLLGVAMLAFLNVAVNMAWAVDNLNASGQTKVNSALAKKWSTSKPPKDGYNNPVDQKRVVNIGNKKGNGCSNVNIGTVSGKTKPGERAPKEIVVTTKEVINVCK